MRGNYKKFVFPLLIWKDGAGSLLPTTRPSYLSDSDSSGVYHHVCGCPFPRVRCLLGVPCDYSEALRPRPPERPGRDPDFPLLWGLKSPKRVFKSPVGPKSSAPRSLFLRSPAWSGCSGGRHPTAVSFRQGGYREDGVPSDGDLGLVTTTDSEWNPEVKGGPSVRHGRTVLISLTPGLGPWVRTCVCVDRHPPRPLPERRVHQERPEESGARPLPRLRLPDPEGSTDGRPSVNPSWWGFLCRDPSVQQGRPSPPDESSLCLSVPRPSRRGSSAVPSAWGCASVSVADNRCFGWGTGHG